MVRPEGFEPTTFGSGGSQRPQHTAADPGKPGSAVPPNDRSWPMWVAILERLAKACKGDSHQVPSTSRCSQAPFGTEGSVVQIHSPRPNMSRKWPVFLRDSRPFVFWDVARNGSESLLVVVDKHLLSTFNVSATMLSAARTPLRCAGACRSMIEAYGVACTRRSSSTGPHAVNRFLLRPPQSKPAQRGR